MMDYNLESFRKVTKEDCLVENIACTINRIGIFFSRSACRALSSSENVEVFFDDENKIMAIGKVKEASKDTFKFSRNRNQGDMAVIMNQYIRDTVFKMMNKAILDKKINYKVQGVEIDGVLYFDLKGHSIADKKKSKFKE